MQQDGETASSDSDSSADEYELSGGNDDSVQLIEVEESIDNLEIADDSLGEEEGAVGYSEPEHHFDEEYLDHDYQVEFLDVQPIEEPSDPSSATVKDEGSNVGIVHASLDITDSSDCAITGAYYEYLQTEDETNE